MSLNNISPEVWRAMKDEQALRASTIMNELQIGDKVLTSTIGLFNDCSGESRVTNISVNKWAVKVQRERIERTETIKWFKPIVTEKKITTEFWIHAIDIIDIVRPPGVL